MKNVLVIGVGNRLRSDDSLGPVVAEAIRREPWSDTDVVVTRGENMDLLSLWKGYRTVVLIDAMSSAPPSGEPIVAFAAHEKPLPASFEKSSTHGMGPMESIELARVLGELPEKVFVVGIAAGDFSIGDGLSPEALALVPRAVAQVRELIQGDSHA